MCGPCGSPVMDCVSALFVHLALFVPFYNFIGLYCVEKEGTSVLNSTTVKGHWFLSLFEDNIGEHCACVRTDNGGARCF